MLAGLGLFFGVNGFKNDRELEVEGVPPAVQVQEKARVYPHARGDKGWLTYAAQSSQGLRDKAMILSLYTSGLRNSTLRALRYEDLRVELKRGLDVVKVPVYPGMKVVDPGVCKRNIPYLRS